MERRIRESFQLNSEVSLVLQRKDEDWGEWIDIEEDTSIPDRALLKCTVEERLVCYGKRYMSVQCSSCC